ncbi:MAG: four helix bundle protein [Desulfobaccales bacterium]
MTGVEKSRSYRDLEVWKRSIALVKHIYEATSQFPPSENFGLVQQMKRAAVSIPSNIAEGQFRNSAKEFKQFLSIALGSTAELETQLIIAHQINYLPIAEFNSLLSDLEIIMKMVRKLSMSLSR